MPGTTLFDKIWNAHVVRQEPGGGPALLYIDLHLVHEVTSPQAFEGLRLAERTVRRPDLTIATVDHNVPTTDRWLPVERIEDEIARQQIETLNQNAKEFGVTLYDIHSQGQGIVHGIIGRIGIGGATGHAVEYTGEAIRSLSVEGRMTVCNMSIEAGARAGMIAPDEKTFNYLHGRRFVPKGAGWDEAVIYWKTL